MLTVLWALGLDIVFGAGVLSLEVWVCENVEGLLRRHKYEPVGSRFWPHVMVKRVNGGAREEGYGRWMTGVFEERVNLCFF